MKGQLKRPRNYNVMQRMRQVADQAKAEEREKMIRFGTLLLQNGINPEPTFR
jgi:hypothetical protein